MTEKTLKLTTKGKVNAVIDEITYWPEAFYLLVKARPVNGKVNNQTKSQIAKDILKREYRRHWLRG